jgi:sec-independent protein translocase protein TatB
MFGLGMSEILVLVVLGLILIGPKELPQLARTLGRFLNELKRTTDGIGYELRQQVKFDLDQRNHIPQADSKKAKVEQPGYPDEDPHLSEEYVHHHEHEPEQMELKVQDGTPDASEKKKS